MGQRRRHWAPRGQSDRNAGIELTQKALGEQLGVKRSRAGEILDEMVKAGRLERMQGRSRYLVTDPETFSP